MVRQLPDWFYPDEFEVEAGLASIFAYVENVEKKAGRLSVGVEDGSGVSIAELTYSDVVELFEYLGDWIVWCEENGYDRK